MGVASFDAEIIRAANTASISSAGNGLLKR